MLEYWLDTVQTINCISAMQELPENSVDLIIADPPYNLSKGNDWSWDNKIDLPGFGGEWNKMMEEWDNMSLSEYFQFSLSWLSEAKRILKPTGSIWVHGTYHNIGIINVSFQMLEIEIINEIIWYKRNAFPNLSGRRFTASHETLLWGHSGGPNNRKYFFNYEKMKEGNFPIDNLKKPRKQMRTVWDIPNNKLKEERSFGTHPNQKPVRLLKRMIISSSKQGDICIAPFSGIGSECAACKELGRHYIGFEIDKEYNEVARVRLNNTERILEQKSFDLNV